MTKQNSSELLVLYWIANSSFSMWIHSQQNISSLHSIWFDLNQIFVGFLYTGWEVLYFCCWQGTICERITDHRSEPSLRSGRTQWVSLYSFIFVNVTAQSVNFICNKNLQVPATAVSLPQHNNYPQTLKQQELRITNRTDNFIQNLDICLLYFIGYLTQN